MQIPVTAVIPALNRERLIARAIESIRRQRGCTVSEIIVVDDGSTDQTAAVADRLGARVVRHEVNRGVAAARNSGFRAATTPWIAYLDSDDEWLAHHLQTLWPHRDDHALVAGAGLGRAADPSDDYWAGPTERRPFVLRSPARLVAQGMFIGPSGVLVRRDALEAVGGSDEALPRIGAEDLDLFIRLLERGTAVVVPVPVSVYHLAGDGAGSVQTDRRFMADVFEDVILRYAGRPWVGSTLIERACGMATWQRLRAARSGQDRAETLLQARTLARRPWQVVGAADLVRRRRRLRRRRWQLSHDGAWTAIVLPGAGDVAAARPDDLPEEITDLRTRPALHAATQVLLHPPARTYVAGRWQGLLARVSGSRAISTRAPQRAERRV